MEEQIIVELEVEIPMKYLLSSRRLAFLIDLQSVLPSVGDTYLVPDSDRESVPPLFLTETVFVSC